MLLEPFWVGDRFFTEQDIELIQATVRRFSRLTRAELAATLCENLPWKAPNGRIRLDACKKLLSDLEEKGILSPPAIKHRRSYQHRNELAELPVSLQLSARLAAVQPVSVGPVAESGLRRWNVTMEAYHPLGYRRPIGAHQRYWIYVQTEDGPRIAGALLYGAAAKALKARDEWIGWSSQERSRHRPRIVNNNRFLILPGVQIPHLASHVLGIAARRIRDDWSARYGYAPVLLETFVEPPHTGTCYLASNWIEIGQTAGRGRQDRTFEYGVSQKSIFVYPLVRHWRRELVAPTLTQFDEEDEIPHGNA